MSDEIIERMIESQVDYLKGIPKDGRFFGGSNKITNGTTTHSLIKYGLIEIVEANQHNIDKMGIDVNISSPAEQIIRATDLLIEMLILNDL